MRFESKTVIITGGASGIGRACAERFCKAGAHVILTDVDSKNGKKTADDFSEYNGFIDFIELDVRNKDGVESVVDQVAADQGSIDILFNNAGISDRTLHENINQKELMSVLNVNAVGTWNGCQAVVPLMKEQGYGSIVNNSSIYGFLGVPKGTSYCLSKGAILNFTRGLAAEVGRDGIRVNAVCPGYVDTPMLAEIFEDRSNGNEAKRRAEAQHALKRLGKPDEIASAVTFLASDDSSFITGHALTVDGGFSIT